MHIDDRLFVAQRLPEGFPHGYTWTLASRLGEMLRRLEERYGPRDSSFTLLGIEFEETGPLIWFPGASRYVIIQLSTNTLKNLEFACYELAHEAVHLLSPTGTDETTVLEEGLAVHFSREYLRDEFGKEMAPKGDRYAEALERVEALLRVEDSLVWNCRQVEPVLSRIGKDLLLQLSPDMDESLADAVTRKFEVSPSP
ncbi:MAG: hypothetical protein KY468_02805 [Armatimonadetes bacterium]|nr:hypothetical protein [Armatimonadota bacterium]